MDASRIKKLTDLRAALKGQGLDGFVLPQDENPACAGRVAWLTGFTGSNALVIVLADKALALTDPRYDIQIERQIGSGPYELKIAAHEEAAAWLAAKASRGAVIGYDPRLHSAGQIKGFEKRLAETKITLRPLAANPIDPLRGKVKAGAVKPVSPYPEKLAGRSAADKREEMAALIDKAGAAAAVITEPESVAWLLNVRGGDVEFTPVALAEALVHANGDVDWFIDPAKVPGPVKAALGNHVQVLPPAAMEESLATVARKGGTVWVDSAHAPIWHAQIVEKYGGKVLDRTDPTLLPKACKTEAEQAAIRKAHITDGVALARFLHWFDKEAPKGKLDELKVMGALLDFRKQDKSWRDRSFETIAGWQENGAAMHYRATPETNARIVPPGFLLLDSGAQYLGGTTDITRTIAVGAVTKEMKDAYTRVLKGHIGIASALFPEGITGQHIDMRARQALWEAGLDYGHRTGHGVGCYLSVHEYAAYISLRDTLPFKPGMLISNEPGYYKRGAFGIRTESLLLVQERGAMEDGRKLLGFDTVTLAPIDTRPVVKALLAPAERRWLNDYHECVRDTIGPLVEAPVRKWLGKACAPI